MALTLLTAGRTSVAEVIASQTVALAVGTGDPAWGATPADPDLSDVALYDPVAMVRASVAGYATKSVGGSIVTDDGEEWEISGAPTPYLYYSFVMDFGEGADETLREIALYFEPTFDGAVPGGQNYIDWADVTDPGKILGIDRFAPITRSGLRLQVERVITI